MGALPASSSQGRSQLYGHQRAVHYKQSEERQSLRTVRKRLLRKGRCRIAHQGPQVLPRLRQDVLHQF